MEMVGIIEDGILDASWSPAQDKLVIHTLKPSIVMLSPNMEVLNEIDLNVDEFSPDEIQTSWRADGQVKCLILVFLFQFIHELGSNLFDS